MDVDEENSINMFDKIRLGFISMIILSIIMCLIELVVGHLTHSIALIADSFHMFFDVISLVIGFVSHQISKYNEGNDKRPFGWSRASVLGGFINSCFMLSLCVLLFRESIERIIHLKKIDNPKIVLLTATIGLVVNIIGFYVFHSLNHENKIKCDLKKLNYSVSTKDILTEYNLKINQPLLDKNIGVQDRNPNHKHNLSGVILHIIGDALGSIFIIISTISIMLFNSPMVNILDPLASFSLAAIMTSSTIPLLYDTSRILMNLPPRNFDNNDFKESLNECFSNNDSKLSRYNLYQVDEQTIICIKFIITGDIICDYDESKHTALIFDLKKLMRSFGLKRFNIRNKSLCRRFS